MKARPVEPVPRTGLTIEESAHSAGVSVATFRRHILENLKVVRIGSAVVVPVDELRRYMQRQAR